MDNEKENFLAQSSTLLFNPNNTVVPITNSEYVLNISCSDQLSYDAGGFPHFHKNDFEIYYLQRGQLEIMVEDETIELKPGEFLITPPQVMHCTLYDPTVKDQCFFVMVFNFKHYYPTNRNEDDQQLTELITSVLERLQGQKYIYGKDMYNCERIIRNMEREVSNQFLGWQTVLHYQYAIFVLSIMRNFQKDGHLPVNMSTKSNNAMRILKYMLANYNRNITEQDVAEELHFSVRHVNRIFSQYFNSSFRKTLALFRLNYAKYYLAETDYSIEKIADKIGCSSNTLFKLFKEFENVTPGDYRRNIQKSDREE